MESSTRMNPITPDTPDGEEQPTNLGSTTPSIGAKRKLTTDQHEDKSTGFYIGRGFPPMIIRRSLPYWIASSFTPSQLIRLSDEEAAVAAYIFGKSSKRETDETDKTDDTEILVRANVRKEIALTTHLKAKYAFEEFALRSGLKTMMPGKLVSRDILDLVVCMLTEEERCRAKWIEYWFFLTSFSQYLMSPRGISVEDMRSFFSAHS